ncbi:tRNA (5-methylaminomethyl-2-thiouridine)(34)-methyltransferase MnmD [Halobacteriovorax sp.]|uniref:tRNA (5-methylaminomethyl-2-thiouridine)(34)-methyltransferase MnmD n=1 Tax=Halobacteriovorax sp. TaxID=2020862 RepID=UPI0035642FE9
MSKLKRDGEITIFEVGYGLGVGAIRTFEKINSLEGKVHFISCELDEGLINWSIENDSHPLLNALIEKNEQGTKFYQSSIGNFHLTIIVGDIRKTLSVAKIDLSLPEFNAIYQDAFSPKKNPHLWTTEWFSELKGLSASDCVLSTYSAAMPIRKSLLSAGWSVFKREGYGEKRSTTIARLGIEMNPVFLQNIENSPEQCLSDKLLKK